MAKCEICTKKVKTTYTCNECGSKFCDKCGDKTKLMCQDCIAYEEELHKGYKPEQEIEVDFSDD
jgi:hypothetical protein